jgi:Ribonuclease H2 non-catalytic subunit (Ylr154p-like)
MQLRVPQGIPLADAERLPCRVAYRGPVEHAEAYFPPPPEEEWQVEGGGEGEERTYAFRGRGLRWQVVPLPDDSQGLLDACRLLLWGVANVCSMAWQSEALTYLL